MSDGSAKPKNQSVSPNIDPTEFPEINWKSDGDIANGLTSLYKHAEARALSMIAWYLRAKVSKSRWSRWLRLLTIVLGTLGGLAPIIDSAGFAGRVPFGGPDATDLGFLMLGLAAACVAVDKLFGFSSGWMRYITTSMAIQEDLSHLRMDWAEMMVRSRKLPLSTADIVKQITRLRSFLDTIDGRVVQETRAWIAEFQTSLADIERAAADGRLRVPGRGDPVPIPGPTVVFPGSEASPDAPVVDTNAAPPDLVSTSETAPGSAVTPSAVPSAPITPPASSAPLP